LKIETQPRDDHQVTLIVEVETERMEGAKRRAARKIAERGKIPGFRPGKAPYEVVRRQYGDEVIVEEAVEILVDDIYPEVLKQADITPAAAGQLENVESVDPPKLKFLVPLAPTVELGKYRSARLPYEYNPPGDDKLSEALDDLRRMYATTETAERPVQEGDFAMLDVKGAKADAEEGEDQSELSRDGYPVFVRPDEKDDEWPFPGFSRKLIGMTPGETRSIAYTYAEDYPTETLQGEAVTYEVTVKTVRGTTMPELDDAFAQRIGAGQTLDDLKQNLRENLDRQAKADYDDKYFVDLLDQIKSGAQIKYPPQVLEHEAEHVLDELKRRLSEQRLDLDTYIKMRQTDLEKFREEEVLPVARRRLERSLLIDELARAEKIEVEEAVLESAFKDNWAMLSASDSSFAKATKGGTRASRELVDAVAMDTANRLMVSNVLDRIKAIATGEAPEPPAEETAEGKASKKKSAASSTKVKKTASKTGKSSSVKAKAKPTSKVSARKPAKKK
jgi:trigger factor